MIIPLCRFKARNYQFSLAFIFAIEEINRNTHILPNTSLGFDLYNVFSKQWNILKETFHCLTGMGKSIPNYTCRRHNKAAALLTGTSWATSAHIGRLLNLYKYPQVRACLCEKERPVLSCRHFRCFQLWTTEAVPFICHRE